MSSIKPWTEYFMNICAQSLSCVQLSVTPWTEAHQAPLSVEFSRQKYWSWAARDQTVSLASPALASRFFTTGATWEAPAESLQNWSETYSLYSSKKLLAKNSASTYVCYSLSHVLLFAIPWTVARQVSLFMEFSRQEYWSGLPFPSPGDLPNPGIEPGSSALRADSLSSEPPISASTWIFQE